MLVQALVPQSTVEGFNEGVVHRLAWATELELHAMLMRPGIERLAPELRAVVDRDALWQPRVKADPLEHRDVTAVDIGWINGKDIGYGPNTRSGMLDLSLRVQRAAATLGCLKNTGNLGPAGKFNGLKGSMTIDTEKIRLAHKNHIHLSYLP